MKIKKEKKFYRSVTLRIAETIMQEVDRISNKENVSRQKLIECIIEAAIKDKNFVVRLNTYEALQN